ncbi:MAG: leucine-rich repeat domain-containing protein [Hormoscilla sp. GUM202]|nr:leucine-rich repeat domain-containing protein [Hormoscilla sp. GUM202]
MRVALSGDIEDDRAFADIVFLEIDRARQDGVTELDISGMGLTEVPSVLGQLTGLQVLYLSSNQISSIPSVLGQLTGLQVLYLSSNQISSRVARALPLKKPNKQHIGSARTTHWVTRA